MVSFFRATSPVLDLRSASARSNAVSEGWMVTSLCSRSCSASASGPVTLTLRVALVTATEFDAGSFMKSGGLTIGAAAPGAT